MRDYGVLRTDELITKFFRMSTEMCVEAAYSDIQHRGVRFPRT